MLELIKEKITVRPLICGHMKQRSNMLLIREIAKGISSIDTIDGQEKLIDAMGKLKKNDCDCQICYLLEDLDKAISGKDGVTGVFHQLPKILKDCEDWKMFKGFIYIIDGRINPPIN